MMLRDTWKGLTAFVVLCSLAFLGCTDINTAGNSTQIGNGMIAGIVYERDGKTPAKGATVSLRKKNTLAPVPGILPNRFADIAVTVTTDSKGIFVIDTLDTGLYVLEATDNVNDFAINDPIAVKRPDSTLLLPPDTLKPAGAIKGVIRLSEGGDPRKVVILAFGIDRFAKVEADGAFQFRSLAEGHYDIRIISTIDVYGVLDTFDIPVKSADTTDLGVIELPFSGIPTLKGVAISYDTLKQRVTIRWSRPDTGVVKSFNLYRRAIDPVTAIFMQLNFFPIIDTIFIDSSCEPNRTYEYRASAVDSNANEGPRSAGAKVQIALYNLAPKNLNVIYDTLRQIMTIHWSNPDTALVKSFNVYRRNVDLNEIFWTPFNDRPIVDTAFVDSTFNICPNYDSASFGVKEPTYEYCAAALIKNIREGTRSRGESIRISLKYLTPLNVNLSYDTLKQTVTLRWSMPDTTLTKSFNIFRRNSDRSGELLTLLNRAPIRDTLFIDSAAGQNQTYEYCIASIVKNNRAQVRSVGVNVRIAAYFIATDSMLLALGSPPEELSNPNDIAVSTNGDMYFVDQGNSRVQVYDSAMNYKRSIGENVLHYPLKVSVDSLGNVFVANYNIDRDCSSIYVFDSTGAVTDTILDSMVINDLDVRNSMIYTITEGRFISIYSNDGNKIRTWQMSGQDGKSIVAGDKNDIYVCAGLVVPNISKVIAFDSLGSDVSSITLPYFPCAIAFDDRKQRLYVVCYDGIHGSMLHVIDKNHMEVARYKITDDDQNISIGLQKNGTVLLALKGERKVYKLKPLFQ